MFETERVLREENNRARTSRKNIWHSCDLYANERTEVRIGHSKQILADSIISGPIIPEIWVVKWIKVIRLQII